MSESPRVYSYLRFSDPKQMQGDSVRRQTEAAEEWAKEHGLELDTELRLQDRGVSGFTGANIDKALGQFLELVNAGEVPKGSYLLVENMDRLSRMDAWDVIPVFQMIINAGITIVTLQDQRTWSREEMIANPFRIFESLMIMIRANEESATKARRVRQAWDEKRKQARENGQVATTVCPEWMEWAEELEEFRLIPERASVVRRIYEETAKGEGQNAITKALNDEGVPTFTNAKRWYRQTLRKYLKHPAVAGYYQPHVIEWDEETRKRKRIPKGDPIADYYPKAVPEGLYRDVQALQKTRAPRRGKNAYTKVYNLFGGIAECSDCGGTVTQVNKGIDKNTGIRYRYLVCATAKSGAGCEYKSVPMKEADAGLLRAVKGGLLDTPPAGDEAGHLEGELLGIEDAMEDAQRAVRNLADEIAKGNASPALRERLEEAEAELGTLRDARKEIRVQIEETRPAMVERRAGSLKEALLAEEIDRTKANALMRQVFKAVTVDRDAGTLTFEWQQGGESVIVFRWTEEEG